MNSVFLNGWQEQATLIYGAYECKPPTTTQTSTTVTATTTTCGNISPTYPYNCLDTTVPSHLKPLCQGSRLEVASCINSMNGFTTTVPGYTYSDNLGSTISAVYRYIGIAVGGCFFVAFFCFFCCVVSKRRQGLTQHGGFNNNINNGYNNNTINNGYDAGPASPYGI